MKVRFLKKVKLVIREGREETIAQYVPGDEKDFEKTEIFERLLKEGVCCPVQSFGQVVHNSF